MLRRVCIESGARRTRQRRVPRIMVWNHGRPVETLSNSRDQRIRPAGVQLMRPREARSPNSSGGRTVVREVSTASGKECSEVGRTTGAAKTDAVSSGTEDGVDAAAEPDGTPRDDFE